MLYNQPDYRQLPGLCSHLYSKLCSPLKLHGPVSPPPIMKLLLNSLRKRNLHSNALREL